MRAPRTRDGDTPPVPTRRTGRATRPGHAGAWIGVLLALGVGVSTAHAQMSPGPLARAHATLDSPTQCFRCHAQGDKSASAMDQRCLACHDEIAGMKAARRGFHPAQTQPCSKCHPDHGGRDFKLIDWDGGSPERFDHKRAGWELQGKHAQAKCLDCHQPKNQKSTFAAKIKRKNRAASFLGLDRPCATCHADPHRNQLGADCLKCHNQTEWKPASGFDHAKTAYPLTGAHGKVECLKCHARPPYDRKDAQGKPLAQWKPLPHAECTSCHKDPHAGRFGSACSKCHGTESFKQIKSSGFNHDLTKYPLRGAHVAVACASCHDEKKAWGPRPKFARCMDCHTDAHGGLATLAGQPSDCAGCHDVKGFDKTTYTAAQHLKSPYPLEGAHAKAPCETCHAKAAAGTPAAAPLGRARVALRPAHAACVDCHADPHAGRFTQPIPVPGGKAIAPRACRDCHTMAAFSPSTYDEIAHRTCVFPLTGAHRATPCQVCHAELKAPASRSTLKAAAASMRPLRFEGKYRVCADCHTSPHGRQFDARKDKGACESCHGVDAFTPASKFVHNRDSAYKLEGAHAKAACASCHIPQTGADGKPVVTYRPMSSKCEDCHGVTTPALPETKRSSSVVPHDRPALFAFTTHEVSHAQDR